MSNSVSALEGAIAQGDVTVSDAGLTGMITLRGNLKSAALAKAVKSAVGVALPAQRGVTQSKKGACAWMSPDELLVLCDYDSADDVVTKIARVLKAEHHLVANVSDARAVITMSGDRIRDVLAQGSPADMAQRSLSEFELRRTRYGQLPVAFWLSSATQAHLICFRSVAEHVFNHLKLSANSLPKDRFH